MQNIMMNFTLNPKYRKTPSEDLFYKLFGFYPKKAGTAFELIATAVMWHLVEKEDIANVILQESSFNASHDVKERSVIENKGMLTFDLYGNKLEVPATSEFAEQFWEKVDRIIDVIAQQQKASAQGSDTSHAQQTFETPHN